ncbi:MAG: hypothetical protein FWD89_02110 [Firmicutes bacterium]|nr:hypothetical protein [Bacillota bacterium]
MKDKIFEEMEESQRRIDCGTIMMRLLRPHHEYNLDLPEGLTEEKENELVDAIRRIVYCSKQGYCPKEAMGAWQFDKKLLVEYSKIILADVKWELNDSLERAREGGYEPCEYDTPVKKNMVAFFEKVIASKQADIQP